jgi:L-galactonate dehydratase
VVSGKLSIIEYIDHLHEHFHHPAVIKDGYYQTPMEPGYSVEMKEASIEKFGYPGNAGGFWKSEAARPILEGGKV